MNRILIIKIVLLSIYSLTHSQIITSLDPDPVVFYNNGNNDLLTFSVNSSTPILISCNFVNVLAPGYASATFGNILSAQRSTPTNITITISNKSVGRVRDFVCNFGNVLITKYLSIRPAITPLICSSNIIVVKSVDTNLSVLIPIKFSDPLTSAATITCSSNLISSNSINILPGTITFTMTIIYSLVSTSSDTLSCTYQMGSETMVGILINIIFQNRTIYFSPNSIVSNAPIIQLNLFSNYIPSTDVVLNCSIIYAGNVNCPISTNASINWTLSTNQAIFKANGAQSVQISMNRTWSIPNTSENYTVVCCDSTNTPYSVNVYIPNLATEYFANATGTETSYGDLNFIQLSSCPCDLTVGICDQNCCCDTFCNCTGSVSGIIGPYGGSYNDPLPRSCSYQDSLSTTTFQSVLCVQTESPNILGDYYPMQTIINDLTTFANVLSSSIRSNVFQIKLTNIVAKSSTISITSNYLSPIISAQYLYLPKQSLNSPSCNLQNPIIYLQGYDSTCTYNVTNTNCNTLDDPRLNSYFYLFSTTLQQTSCNNNVSISSVQSNVQVFTFYSCISGGVSSNCSWDNGYTLPQAPQINNISNTCDNVVSSASYTLYYNSSGIVYIRADVGLSSISYNSNIAQKFKVSFVSTNATKELSLKDSFTALQGSSQTTVSNLSGLYGYDDGKPILTVNNSSNPVFVPLKSLPISPSGLCNNIIGNNVLFNQNNLVQCNFDISSLNNCGIKRINIKKYLDSLFSNSYVAVYGNPSTSADYVTVSTTNLSLSDSTNVSGIVVSNNFQIPLESMSPNYCANITTGIITTIYYTRQGRAQNAYINNIVGVSKSYQISNIASYFVNNTNSSNLITLMSYVKFQLVSANISSSQSTDDNVQRVCNYDICFNELFYPWMFNYEGKQGFYEEAFGLMLLGLAIFLLATTYPWW